MARGRSGPGYVGMMIFLFLCLALVVGYVPVTGALLKRSEALNDLQRGIKVEVEDHLGDELGIRAKAVPSAGDAAYDRTFFRKVRETAEDGVLYDGFLKTVGVGRTPDPVKTLSESYSLDSTMDLVTYIEGLKRELAQAKTSVERLKRAEAGALEKRKGALSERDAAIKRKTEAIDEYEKKFSKQKTAYDKNVSDYKKQWAEAVEQATGWADELAALKTTYKAKVADLDKELADKIAEAEHWRKIAERPIVKPAMTVQGKILQADAIERVAIINLGRKQGIKLGDKFTVMRPVLGGGHVPKGEIHIIRVEEYISTGDIMKEIDEGVIVMNDDMVVRQENVAEKRK